MTEEIDLVLLIGQHNRSFSIAKAIIQTDLDIKGDLLLEHEDSGQKFLGYAYRVDPKNIALFILVEQASKEQEIDLVLSPENVISNHDSFNFKPVELKQASPEKIDVKINGSIFTSFYYNMSQRPFLMPITGPYGESLTRQYPIKDIAGQTTDHIHHRSCWSAWGDINGIDNWSEGSEKGFQLVESLPIIHSGMVLAHIQANINWMDPKKEKIQIKEKRDIFFYNSRNAERMVDFRIELTANEDITLGDTKEGGFITVRVATPLDVPKGGIITNGIGGVQEPECWGKRAPWCDYSGLIKGKMQGISLFDHPNNYNYPTYWHVRDYGLMAANPLGISEFIGKSHNGSLKLKKDDKLIFNYRLLTHTGTALEANIQTKYTDYVYSPIIKRF